MMGAFEFMDVLRKKNDVENLQRKIAIIFAITNINNSYTATIRDQYEDLKEEYEETGDLDILRKMAEIQCCVKSIRNIQDISSAIFDSEKEAFENKWGKLPPVN